MSASTFAQLSGKAGGLRAQRPADDPERIQAEQDFHEAKLARYVERVVEGLPALRPEQRTRVAALLADTAVRIEDSLGGAA